MDDKDHESEEKLESSGLDRPTIKSSDVEEVIELKSTSKKPLLIIIALILVITMGAATWFFTKNNKPITDSQPAAQTTPDPALDRSKSASLIYSYGNPEDAGLELFWRPLSGGDRSSAKNIGAKNYIVDSGVFKNQVFVVTSPGSGSSDGTIVWYSSDSGRTYEKIVSLSLPPPERAGEQITSTAFSLDGTKIVYGFLAENGKGNTIREVDLQTKDIKDLFTVNTDGIFLEAYDSTKKQIYYYTGCFNCDGVFRNKLFVRDIAKNVETVVYELPGKYGMDQVFNSDLTKMLIVEGSQSTEGLGGGPPYVVKELDVSSKTLKDLLTVDDSGEYPSHPGYRDGDNMPYIAQGKSVFMLATDGTKTQVYEANQPITAVLYVGKDQVVAAAGTFESYVVTNFVLSTQTSTKLLEGDQSAQLFGVVWQ